MPKHDRNRLKVDQVEDFAQFATNLGASVRPGKGQYQLVQVKTTGPDWHAICCNALGVVTTHPSIRQLIDQFHNREALAAPTGAVILKLPTIDARPPRKSVPVSESAKQYAADLRDDAAIEFMGSIMLKNSDLAAITDAQIDATARLAYLMADALLRAGGHA